MRALTIQQPYAELVAQGVKSVENRAWKPPAAQIGERIAIHAGQKLAFDYRERHMWPGGVHVRLRAIRDDLPEPSALAYGAVIATARLAGWVAGPRHDDARFVGRHVQAYEGVSLERATEIAASEWWMGPIGWVLEDVVRISPPSTCKGRLGLWDLGRFTAREVAIREEAARG